ncbi:MAG TPA: hypothetical protein VF665_16020 [Longimicrobium sp.]|jgi:hypothetical protein|uniref:hypothetical protein n=1 Tax=Longimicrobium sp. TaxID=2029185 RepID=UPI002EDAF7CD
MVAERDLIAMIDGALNESVAQAAKAVLRYKRGASLQGAVTGTDHSVGWIRSLIDDVRSNGVEALRLRKYRSPKARGEQRARAAAKKSGARASPKATGAAARAAKKK